MVAIDLLISLAVSTKLLDTFVNHFDWHVFEDVFEQASKSNFMDIVLT